MTEKEAEEYLQWHRDKVAEYHYLAHFSSSKPFAVDYPNAYEKKNQALIVLGKHEYQRSYEQLLTVYPNLTEEQYKEKRIKHGIDPSDEDEQLMRGSNPRD